MKKVGEDRVKGLVNVASILTGVGAVLFILLFVAALMVFAALPDILKVLFS